MNATKLGSGRICWEYADVSNLNIKSSAESTDQGQSLGTSDRITHYIFNKSHAH